jgi:CubicO group peptidase (beta-lactamase class C family)
MKHLYVSLLSVTSLLACSGAPQKPSTLMLNNTADAFQATMTQLIEHQMSTGDVPGLSIAVVNDQDVIWRQGFGTSNRGTQQLVTADTQFQAGSLTKIFTAVAVMQQIEQGKMQVDDSLATHIPEFSIHSRFGPTDTITLRNLMTHHSGLPGDYVSGMWMTQPSNVKPPSVDFKHYVKTLSHEYQSFPVHTIHAYSNIGYTLLGEAVTRTAQQDYASYINNAQLKPLAMDNSYVSHELCQPGVAIGYGGPNAASACTLRDIAAGGLITTVNDLTHFIKMPAMLI